jgi:branched-chain amino acid transport system ATP-binding protein
MIVSEPILTLTDVVVAFDALRAVDGINLTVPRGQRRAIIGPNGAGKTTLFNAIAGAVPPTSGRISFDGHDITRLPPHRRAQLGISRTFQITNLFPTLSVHNNMILALRGLSSRKFSLFGLPDTDSAEAARIAAALGAARLATRADVTVKELSYGEQRQLELERDITVVLIEHDMDLALGIVDFVTCMFEGRILVEEPPEGIRRNARVQEVYLGKPRHA